MTLAERREGRVTAPLYPSVPAALSRDKLFWLLHDHL
jgi:hypothetical protein